MGTPTPPRYAMDTVPRADNKKVPQKSPQREEQGKRENSLTFFILGDFMPIFTTYLGFLNKHGGANKVAMNIGSCFVYYVARDRGNNQVAPGEWLYPFLKLWKAMRTKETLDELWKQYEENYLIQIGLNKLALLWMENRAQEAKIGNILLVCYEKDAQHCHRRLLAEEIARRFGAEYKGEVEEPAHLYSLDGKPDKFNYQ